MKTGRFWYVYVDLFMFVKILNLVAVDLLLQQTAMVNTGCSNVRWPI